MFLSPFVQEQQEEGEQSPRPSSSCEGGEDGDRAVSPVAKPGYRRGGVSAEVYNEEDAAHYVKKVSEK